MLWIKLYFTILFGFAVKKAIGLYRSHGSQCGYNSCPVPKEGKLNVHLVPHSHDDIGWLKTVDQYFYGERNDIHNANVGKIIDSVVSELGKNKSRRFIQVESGFLWRWWTERGEKERAEMQRLVQTGQLEFVNGGWSQNDEVTTHYSGIIDQMSLGLRFLNDTFGTCGRPPVTWQIDPFGHSREQASLSAAMGFDGEFVGRIDYADKKQRMKSKNMEMIWNSNPNNLDKDSWLFTSINFNGYSPPKGYCFDILCSDSNLKRRRRWSRSVYYGIKDRLENFYKVAQEWAEPYRTNNVLMTMGMDFYYQEAGRWYTNMDKLINYYNTKEDSPIHVLYSTPSCYLQAVNQAGLQWPVKTDDFLPYLGDEHEPWTGYFRSRPTFKYYMHKALNFLQATKQLVAAVSTDSNNDIENDYYEDTFAMEDAVAIGQHHDAITGTAKQHVTDDYKLRVSLGFDACEKVVDTVLQKLDKSGRNSPYKFCQKLNISVCEHTNNDEFIVSVYNPLARDIDGTYVRLPVTTPHWIIQGSNTNKIDCQSVYNPAQLIDSVRKEGRVTEYDVVFPVDKLPGLTLTKFKLTRTSDTLCHITRVPRSLHRESGEFTIQNSAGLTLHFVCLGVNLSCCQSVK